MRRGEETRETEQKGKGNRKQITILPIVMKPCKRQKISK
jgi:hypothetical protein